MEQIRDFLNKALIDGWIPFVMLAGGSKPKANTIRLVEVMLILGFLWWRIDAIEENIEKRIALHETSHIRIETQLTNQHSYIIRNSENISRVMGILNAD